MSLIKIKVKYSESRKRKIGSSKKLPMYVLNKPFFNILVYLPYARHYNPLLIRNRS